MFSSSELEGIEEYFRLRLASGDDGDGLQWLPGDIHCNAAIARKGWEGCGEVDGCTYRGVTIEGCIGGVVYA